MRLPRECYLGKKLKMRFSSWWVLDEFEHACCKIATSLINRESKPLSARSILFSRKLPSHAARAFAENRHAATSRRTCS